MRFGKTKYLLAAAMLAIVASGLRAQEAEAPYSGQVMNTEGPGVISYHCEQTAPSKISCDFKSVTIKASLEEADRPAAFANMKEQFADEEEVSNLRDWACDLRDKLGDEGVSLEELHALIPMHIPETGTADAQAVIELMGELCTDRSNAPLEHLAEVLLDIESRTCVVSTSSWTSEFVGVSEGAWVIDTQVRPPFGPCGAVETDRFEHVDSTGMFSFWNFMRHTISTNPNGHYYNKKLCSEVYSDDVQVYSPLAPEIPLNCSYFRFGMIL